MDQSPSIKVDSCLVIKKFLAFYGKQKNITAFTTDHQLTL